MVKDLNIVHLSDTHLTAGRRLLHSHIDPWMNLAEALCAAEDFFPDAVVLTGDIADRGDDIHRQAAKILEEAQQQLGCPIITIPGNHDPAGSIGQLFNSNRISTGPHPANTVHEINGLRIIGLDSGGFQQAQGGIDDLQLDWLRQLLSVQAPAGTLLLLHHPPMESFSPVLAGRGLADPQALTALVAGSDVRAILCGHYHQTGSSQLFNTPVFIAPAVSFNMNPCNPREVLAQNQALFSVLRISGDSVMSLPVSSQHALQKPVRTRSYLSHRYS